MDDQTRFPLEQFIVDDQVLRCLPLAVEVATAFAEGVDTDGRFGVFESSINGRSAGETGDILLGITALLDLTIRMLDKDGDVAAFLQYVGYSLATMPPRDA